VSRLIQSGVEQSNLLHHKRQFGKIFSHHEQTLTNAPLKLDNKEKGEEKEEE